MKQANGKQENSYMIYRGERRNRKKEGSEKSGKKIGEKKTFSYKVQSMLQAKRLLSDLRLGMTRIV
jgi:hypothetical protein